MIVAHPPVSLVAAPARVVLAGAARETVSVHNSGTTRVVVVVSRSRYALDLRGRPHVVSVARPAALLVRVSPSRIALAPGATASLQVRSVLPHRPEPGDHPALLLLTTRPIRRAAVAVRMRLGIVVLVRVPGRVVHRLALLRLRALAHRRVELLLANRGNVTERIDGRCLRLQLRHGQRVVATLRPLARDLLPRTRGLVEFRYARSMRLPLVASLIRPARSSCGRVPARRFPLRR
jgi:hypothetical protein